MLSEESSRVQEDVSRGQGEVVPKVVHCKVAPPGTFIYVGRPTKYGNPFSHKEGTRAQFKVDTAEEAVARFEEWFLANDALVADAKRELKGHDLGCWCVLKGWEPCHAKVLLKVANEVPND